jgi:AmpE protein
MEFLSILIVLGLLQLWGSGGPMQQDKWFNRACENIIGTFSSSYLRLLLLVAGPAIVLLIVQSWFESVLFGLLSLLLYIACLLYGLGRGDFSENLQAYLSAWNHGNFETAYRKAEKIGDFKQTEHIVDHASLHEHVRAAFMYEGLERWFSVIFWFLLLGPVGAVAYRLSYLCGRSEHLSDEDQQLALRVLHYLDWVPARLLSFSFALTGNFVNSFNEFWEQVFDNQPAVELVDSCALAALKGDNDQSVTPADQEHFIKYARNELLALQGLLSRSVVCWIIVIAATTLFT